MSGLRARTIAGWRSPVVLHECFEDTLCLEGGMRGRPRHALARRSQPRHGPSPHLRSRCISWVRRHSAGWREVQSASGHAPGRPLSARAQMSHDVIGNGTVRVCQVNRGLRRELFTQCVVCCVVCSVRASGRVSRCCRAAVDGAGKGRIAYCGVLAQFVVYGAGRGVRC
eukprot:scaffold33143_cov129-Isochrysis_galbana.AAC.1